MALADRDLAGDLHIVANNYQASAVLFKNPVCGGASCPRPLTVTLPDGAKSTVAGLRAGTLITVQRPAD